MALKKIRETKVGPVCSVKIYRDSEYGEHVIKTMCGKTVIGTAFESDLAAARGTAAAQVRWLRRKPYKR